MRNCLQHLVLTWGISPIDSNLEDAKDHLPVQGYPSPDRNAKSISRGVPQLFFYQTFALSHPFIIFSMYHSSSKNDPRKMMQDKQQPSRVLLVCVYDTIALQVSNQVIYERFSRFGSIIKVLIFEKGEVTKLFVQFTDKNHAQQAKNALDGTKLLGAICKMNIYFSNFTNVDLKNETSEGADFTMQEEMRNDYIRRFDHLSRSFQSEENDVLNDGYLMETAFSSFLPRSKTDNPRRLQEEMNRVNGMQSYGYPHMINEAEQIDTMINHGINNLLETHSSHSSKPYPHHTHSTNSSLERINPALKIKEVSQAKSQVLHFDLHKDVSIKCIYNLFSNFGNISFISKKNKKAYIKFRTMEFAAIAFTYLNEYFLMGNLLRLQSPQSADVASPRESEYCECVFYDQSYDRFTPHRSLTVNSPSQTLHVSSLKKQICKQNTLFNIFSEYGKVQAVKILCYSNEKNMALVKFYSMQDSFQAIAHLHNETFSGRKMQISFTKSKV